MVRVGIVGCGRILAAHLKGYRLLREAGFDQFEITALCSRRREDALSYLSRDDRYPQRKPVSDLPGDPLAVGEQYLDEIQPGVKVSVFDNYTEMIASDLVDGVNDFTHHELHPDIAAFCAEHRKHLFTQKPLAVTLADAKRMCESMSSADLTFGVFENWRFRAQTRYMKWLADSGRLGQSTMLLFANVGQWWAPDQIVAETPWRHSKSGGGGISLDMGPHIFHFVRHVVGEVSRVWARTPVIERERRTLNQEGQVTTSCECDADDTFMAQIVTEAGVVGTLNASWAGSGESTVVGPGPILYFEKGRVSGDLVSFKDGTSTSLQKLYEDECPRDRQDVEFPMGLLDGFALAQYSWLRAVIDRGLPETSGEEGVRDLACSIAMLVSNATGEAVNPADLVTGVVSETF
jgi:1,5-anhydro-D-fructose reductase (1,5-anhydro-D-mannitol-forming)